MPCCLRLLLVRYGALQKDRSLFAHYTPYGAFCSMEWRLHDSVWIFRRPKPRILLIHEPSEEKMGFFTKSQAVEGGVLRSTPSCSVRAVYPTANSSHFRIQWCHLLLFPLVIP
jgi:hypothetical protein